MNCHSGRRNGVRHAPARHTAVIAARKIRARRLFIRSPRFPYVLYTILLRGRVSKPQARILLFILGQERIMRQERLASKFCVRTRRGNAGIPGGIQVFATKLWRKFYKSAAVFVRCCPCISFCRMASSAGQKSYCGISAGVIQRRALCSKSCGTPSAIAAW